MHDILMPEASKSGALLTVHRWLKRQGERVEKGQVIALVEGDGGLIELESGNTGVLAEVLAPTGKSVKVGTLIARLSEGEVDVRSVGASRQGSAAPVQGVEKTPVEQSQAISDVAACAATTNANAVPVLMPQAGNSMEEGTIVKWRVKEGDRISKGQVIFEVETDKATLEVEATEEGRVAKIIIPEGGVQKVKEPVAFLAENDADVRSVGASRQGSAASAAPAWGVEKTPVQESQASPVLAACAATTSDGRVKASPAARKLAAEKGWDLASVAMGSGPGGRILSTDLANAMAAGRPAAALSSVAAVAPVQTLTATEIVRKTMTKMRKAIAANLQASKQSIPHFYLRATIHADALMAYYKGEKAKYPCSLNDVVVLALSRAIIEFPAFRSKIDKDEIVEYPSVNIGVAVGVEDGLTVPVLLNAHAMTLQQISANTKRIVELARNGKLEGFGQGNFTITNLGMFGVEEFAAIVNPPEPGILAVGAAREAVIVKDGAMKAGRVMTLTLSCDHRIIDGLMAARFMARLKELLENPTVLA